MAKTFAEQLCFEAVKNYGRAIEFVPKKFLLAENKQ